MTHPRTVVKVEADEPVRRLALLIDADNAQAGRIEGLLAEVAKLGEATVRRIYGDFTSPQSASWKKVLNRHSIKPVQQFAYTTGKNASDSALIIDAMDLLYTRRFEGFCLVSSDSDFTGLASRLREEGLQVYGFGERKTPEAFRNACNRFVFVEVLGENGQAGAGAAGTAAGAATGEAAQAQAARKLDKKRLLEALERTADDDGWATLAHFGSYLRNLQPDFDPRHYGFKKLSDLVAARKDVFELERREVAGGGTVMRLRAR